MIIYPYIIEECGFYKRGEKTPEFGSVDYLLTDFIDWINSRPNVIATSTFNTDEDNIRRVFCLEAFLGDNETGYGVVLWNEMPQHEEGIASISIQSRVGNVKASTTEMSEASIPGWPTYLWFIPKKSIVISLVPDNMRGFRSSGIRQTKKYFEHFLEMYSSYVAYEKTNEDNDGVDKEVIGWRIGGDEPNKKLYCRFRAKELRLPGHIDLIRDRYNEIRKLIIKTHLSLEIPQQKTLLDSLLKVIGLSEDEEKIEDYIKYKSEMEWAPNKAELEEVILKWEDRVNEDGDSYDAGVTLKGESNKIYWFGKARAKSELELPHQLQEEVLWTSEQLKQVWSLTRNRIEDTLRRAGK